MIFVQFHANKVSLNVEGNVVYEINNFINVVEIAKKCIILMTMFTTESHYIHKGVSRTIYVKTKVVPRFWNEEHLGHHTSPRASFPYLYK